VKIRSTARPGGDKGTFTPEMQAYRSSRGGGVWEGDKEGNDVKLGWTKDHPLTQAICSWKMTCRRKVWKMGWDE